MSSRKKKSGKNKAAGGMRGLAVSLAVIAIVIISLYRFFETTKGRVFLVDIGLKGGYEEVQGRIGAGIREALEGFAVRAPQIEISRELSKETGKSIEVLKVEVPHGASIIQVNAAVDKAVSALGAEVRSCREKSGGRVIEMEIGTRGLFGDGTVTHKCTFRLSKRGTTPYRREETGPAISIVVDDFGFFNNKLVRDFLSLDIPITVSVIPGLKHSPKICRMAGEKGKEILCHLPMEPEKGADDVGDIPLVRAAMTGGEIEEIVEKALDTTPGVIGFNNHMGSLATADRRVMDAVLKVCKRRDLVFFDSLTSPASVVREAAADAGVGSARNDLFLDNNKKDTRENMKKLISLAIKRGKVSAIMHVRKESLEDLKWMIGEASSRGVRFVKLTEIIEEQAVAANKGGRT
ncbi:MAG TPA: divergent polysaccharide deacetylase family protein [Candidatus Krumholzibacterium sp.]|nr:divergent polysaccharide deacetylase family protein [Candidatus Krumholzibacterium sp.]